MKVLTSKNNVSAALLLTVLIGIFQGCAANCPDCSEQDPMLNGTTDDHGCVPAAGQIWCSNKQQCISISDDCLVEEVSFEGPTSLQCQDGKCRVNKACRTYMSSFTLRGSLSNPLDGTFNLPSGCTADCTGCQQRSMRSLRGDNFN
ncbi:expressed unknown protein [Seminavis robusta]|uniref:Lipoprotein n=1 Tax=Seminavis robusta TaxID=568900 RepID=A0A9N8ENZ3_9STRA|nr:expressed unknown protein [Seminavis robusta]|eukprot:Sro1422_g271250.1 n/a (146) ;mRNA; f:1237-1674